MVVLAWLRNLAMAHWRRPVFLTYVHFLSYGSCILCLERRKFDFGGQGSVTGLVIRVAWFTIVLVISTL